MSGINWSTLAASQTIVNYTTEIIGRDVSAVTWLDSSLAADTNVPTKAKRWNNTNKNWEVWNGTAWAALATSFGINITGSAGSVAWAGITGKPTTVSGYGITDIAGVYAPLTGTGASGTWGINISGSAAQLGGVAAASYAQLASPNFSGTPKISGVDIGTKIVPQNIQSGSYTLALTDNGKHIYSQNSGAQTLTIPTNASVAFPIGTAITLVNNGITAITFSYTGVTVYKAGTSTAWASGGTLAIRGMVTLLKTNTNEWFISGSGLS